MDIIAMLRDIKKRRDTSSSVASPPSAPAEDTTDSIADSILDIIRRRRAAARKATQGEHEDPNDHIKADPYLRLPLDKFLTELHPDKPELLGNIRATLLRITTFTGVPFVLDDGPWLAGGCLRQAVEGKACRTDYDIFFGQDDAIYNKVLDGLTENAGGAYALFHTKIQSEHVTNFESTEDPDAPKIQLIHGIRKYFGPKDVLHSFDFRCCELITDGKEILLNALAVEDIQKRLLKINNVSFAPTTLPRIAKYGGYGYKLEFEEAKNFLKYVVDNPSKIKENGDSTSY